MHRIGIDLGGTKIEAVALAEDGRELLRKRTLTESTRGYAAILEKIASLYQDILAALDGAPHTIGVGTPGTLSDDTRCMKNSNTLCLNGRPLHTDLVRTLGRELRLENDANCFALAEATLGAAQGKPVVFGVIMGTGCGGGLVLDGRIHTGLQRIAGEWGHMVLDPAGPPCYCGAKGCVETFISGGGLERRYREKTGESLRLPEIVERSRSGDGVCRAEMGAFFRHFGQAMANLINTLDPDAVVLGGGVSNVEELYSIGVQEVARRTFTDSFRTPILRNRLGDSAGVLGAALIGR